MFAQFVAWYLLVQLIALITLPLALRFFGNLPDRGYALARVLGILLVGYIFWFAYSFGFVRFEPGGAWLAVIGTAVISAIAGWPILRTLRAQLPGRAGWAYIVGVELIFLLAFAAWAWVRAHDPAANHTEKPMDLMFMNSIRASATYPPMDAWLAGHPISYYYFGYWLLTSLGMLAGQPPEIAYNLGQACWYGLLLSTSFGVAYNLLAATGRRILPAAAGGLVGAVWIGMAANLQGILEWLHANGVDVSGIAGLLKVPGFPQEAAVTNQWYIDYGWWWWRSSRVIGDLDLAGNHIEVIDEFPVFSYILGDNHPHVVAMPFVLLVIAIALNLFLHRRVEASAPTPAAATDELIVPEEPQPGSAVARPLRWLTHVRHAMPLGWAGWLLTAVAAGALLFLNTWDFPPYWLLLGIALGAVLWRHWPEETLPGAIGLAAVSMIGLLVAALVLYLPYFLTAQSQAGGVVPNLFNPTRFGQFVAMFASALLALIALIVLGWAELRPTGRQVAASFALVFGLPLLFLAVSVVVVTATPVGQEILARMPLPPGESSHLTAMLGRWFGQPFTFLVTGALLALVAALAWRGLTARTATSAVNPPSATPFVLALAGIGLLLVYAPEFVFLRDNFGTRMNTIFKFYYQAWLLFGLAGAFTVVVALGGWRGWRLAPALLSSVALVLVLASTVYLFAGAYSKTGGFASAAPTFDATDYLANFGPDELAAVRWVRDNTPPDAWVLEAKGGSYRAEHNRISTMTGRPTLLGWEGHESQWRGRAYGDMAAGRPQVLETIYRDGTPEAIATLVEQWGIDYVYVGPAERSIYQVTPSGEERLRAVMDLAFESGDVRIYRAR